MAALRRRRGHGSVRSPAEIDMSASERVKLRMKIGVHELEAEGPRDLVMAQLEIWKRLAGLPDGAAADRVHGETDAALRSLFDVQTERKLVTLRAALTGQKRNADAALLLLYGYRTFLDGGDGTGVPAVRLRAAVAASSYRVQRLDRALTQYIAAGLLQKAGRYQHTTYALTASGAQRAAALVRRLTLDR